jgi:hypothetical protein
MPMPVLVYFAVIGSVLVTLLFVADTTLEKNVSSPIVTSQRTGLPTPRYQHANTAKAPTTVPAPAPDMTSQDVLAAQPKSAPDALPTIESKAKSYGPANPIKPARSVCELRPTGPSHCGSNDSIAAM